MKVKKSDLHREIYSIQFGLCEIIELNGLNMVLEYFNKSNHRYERRGYLTNGKYKQENEYASLFWRIPSELKVD